MKKLSVLNGLIFTVCFTLTVVFESCSQPRGARRGTEPDDDGHQQGNGARSGVRYVGHFLCSRFRLQGVGTVGAIKGDIHTENTIMTIPQSRGNIYLSKCPLSLSQAPSSKCTSPADHANRAPS